MRIAYKTFNFRPATLAVIVRANQILEEYERQGFDLTLRQLYYQFVARGLIPNDARLGGLNRARRPRSGQPSRTSARSASGRRCAPSRYAINLLEGQTTYVEVWVEKDALV